MWVRAREQPELPAVGAVQAPVRVPWKANPLSPVVAPVFAHRP